MKEIISSPRIYLAGKGRPPETTTEWLSWVPVKFAFTRGKFIPVMAAEKHLRIEDFDFIYRIPD